MLMEIFGPDQTALIVIVSILGGVAIVWAIVFGVVAVVKLAMRHRERMAAIGMGLDPDKAADLLSRPSNLPSAPPDSIRR
jgi:hypothetical protein